MREYFNNTFSFVLNKHISRLSAAYEAETAQNDRDAEILYSILDAYE